jgi:hypothetical protein
VNFRCPACKELEPVWKQVAAEVKDDGVLVGKVLKERLSGWPGALFLPLSSSIYPQRSPI